MFGLPFFSCSALIASALLFVAPSGRSDPFITKTIPVSGDSLFRAWIATTVPCAGCFSCLTSHSFRDGLKGCSEELGALEAELPAIPGSGDMVSRLPETSLIRGFYRANVELSTVRHGNLSGPEFEKAKYES